jgi:hypothetical protein
MSQDKYQDMSPSLIEALKFFIKNELAMTDDEFAQTRIQYNRQTRELTVDFGDGQTVGHGPSSYDLNKKPIAYAIGSQKS